MLQETQTYIFIMFAEFWIPKKGVWGICKLQGFNDVMIGQWILICIVNVIFRPVEAYEKIINIHLLKNKAPFTLLSFHMKKEQNLSVFSLAFTLLRCEKGAFRKR